MSKLLKGIVSILCLVLMLASAYAMPPPRPNKGKKLYAPPWRAEIARLVARCATSREVSCGELSWLTAQPHAYWMGFDTLQEDLQNLHAIILGALAEGTVPTIVLYSLPDRECGGGIRNHTRVTVDDYKLWIALIATAVRYYGNAPINIIIEPGGLARVITHTDELCHMRRKSEVLEERVELIRYVLWNFIDQDRRKNRHNPNVRLFLDVGGPDTLLAPHSKLAMTRALKNILRSAEFDGVSVNVSGRASFDESAAWGKEIIDLLSGQIKRKLTLAIDISRAGSTGEKGCNAPGAKLDSEPPTLSHAQEKVELAMMIHDPSTSDGDREGCRGGAPAGEFDLEVLREYLNNSAPKEAIGPTAVSSPKQREDVTTMIATYFTGLLRKANIGTSRAEIGVAQIVTKQKYELIFPRHVAFYSYEEFVRGAAATEGFCTTGDTPTRIRECAAFLANAAHETGGGKYVTEIAQNKCPDYCDKQQVGACALAPGQSYYGRGWLQISWNYNYCAASKFIFGDDGSTLVKDPGFLERDAAISTRASLWYWMTQASAGTMPSHACITSGAGFGCTVRSINGALECNGVRSDLVRARVDHYLRILDILSDGKVQPVGRNDC